MKPNLTAELGFWQLNDSWHKDLRKTVASNTAEVLEMLVSYHGPTPPLDVVLEIGSGVVPSARTPLFKHVIYLDPLLPEQIKLLVDRGVFPSAEAFRDYLQDGQNAHLITEEFSKESRNSEAFLQSSQVDAVICRNGLDHIADLPGALDVIYDLLTPAGVVIIPKVHLFDYAGDNPGGIIQWGRKTNIDGVTDDAHPWTFNKLGFLSLVAQAGFHAEGIEVRQATGGWNDHYWKGLLFKE